MSFLDQVEKIQKKPDHVRQKIAVASTLIFTVLIVATWAVLIKPLSKINNTASNNNNYDPLAVIKDTANSASPLLDKVKDSLGQVKNYSGAITDKINEQAATDQASSTANDQFAPDDTSSSSIDVNSGDIYIDLPTSTDSNGQN